MHIFIVTPSFNSVETIDQTILSVITQPGNFHLHYHIQDGGSDDGTINKLESWKNRITSGWFNNSEQTITFSYAVETDFGMYDAIIKGFSRFNLQDSDWMGWINSDDILLRSALPLLSKLEDLNKDSFSIDWVCGASTTASENIQITQSERKLCSEVISLGLCDGKHWGYVQQEGTFFRYKAWKSAGAKDAFGDLKYAADWRLWYKMAEKNKIFQYIFPTGIFSSREGQLSQVHRTDYDNEIEQEVSFQLRTKHLHEIENTKSIAYYLVPDQQTNKITIEERPISPHVEFRLKSFPISENRNSLSKQTPSAKSSNSSQLGSAKRNGQIIAFDSDWQYPAITEQHAFKQILKFNKPGSGIVYFAFPWATLIDLLNRKENASAKFLMEKLHECTELINRGETVITVCQHILLLNYQDMFANAGINHVYWTHAIKNQKRFPKHSRIKVSPFPLFPVQAINETVNCHTKQSYLFSFIGARSNIWYLTPSRNMILDYLSDDNRGFVTGRKTWHFNKIVYDHQIAKSNTSSQELISQSNEDEYKKVMRDSTFSLCPSGTGPNSIRLWESIGFGSIPVILADTYLLPGNIELWEEAVIICKETEQDIKALPNKLALIAEDKELLARKRHALKQLWMLYGPKLFIHDIQKLFLIHEEKRKPPKIASKVAYKNLIYLAKEIEDNIANPKTKSENSTSKIQKQLSLFLLGCQTRLLQNPNEFKSQLETYPELQIAFYTAMRSSDDTQKIKLLTTLTKEILH